MHTYFYSLITGQHLLRYAVGQPLHLSRAELSIVMVARTTHAPGDIPADSVLHSIQEAKEVDRVLVLILLGLFERGDVLGHVFADHPATQILGTVNIDAVLRPEHPDGVADVSIFGFNRRVLLLLPREEIIGQRASDPARAAEAQPRVRLVRGDGYGAAKEQEATPDSGRTIG